MFARAELVFLEMERGYFMRILIIDDHPLFCDGLKLLLNAMDVGSETDACTTAADALKKMADSNWDLLLLDWNLGSSHPCGAELIRQLKNSAPMARVVVISAEVSPRRVREAVEAGAVGFVPKEASAALLIDAIRITSHGGIYLPASVLEAHDDTLAAETQQLAQAENASFASASLRAHYPRLTSRQSDVLVCMVRGQSNKQIARTLVISDGTVKQHLYAVYKEMGVSTRTEAVYLLAQKGIKVF